MRNSADTPQAANRSGVTLGLIPQQEIVDVQVPAFQSGALHEQIMMALSKKAAHRIVSMTMTATGEFPLDYRVLIVIEYV